MTETKVVKITKKMRFEEIKGILENLERADLVEFVDKELELLAKKSASRSSKPTKRQSENVDLKEEIYSAMTSAEADNGLTCTDIAVLLGGKVSTQRIQPQLKVLISENKVENFKEKGVSLYKVKED